MSQKHFVLASCYDKRGRLLSRRANSYTRTHPLQAAYAKRVGQPARQFLHAELNALLAARNPVYHLHVERYNAYGEPVNAKPCKICQLAIKEWGVKRVTHT